MAGDKKGQQIKLDQTKADTVLALKGVGFSMEEIKDMTMLQVQLYIQRNNEPGIKAALEAKIDRALNNTVIKKR